MSVYLDVSGKYIFESANYITCINPMLHPDRILTYHDFLYIIDGSWEIGEEENVYSLQADDLVILEAGKHHYGVKPCSAGNRHMYVHAAEAGSQIKAGQMPRDEKTAVGVTENAGTFKLFQSVIHCQNNPRIKQMLEEIISVMWSEEELKETKLELLFGLFLCELYKQQSAGRRAGVNIVDRAVGLIQTAPQMFFSASDMAAQFFVCERTLNNLFRKAFGKSFYKYQMDRKLEMVRQYLMLHPDSKLDEAARNFGFCDEFHLGKAYKKKYGVSPKRHTKCE